MAFLDHLLKGGQILEPGATKKGTAASTGRIRRGKPLPGGVGEGCDQVFELSSPARRNTYGADMGQRCGINPFYSPRH